MKSIGVLAFHPAFTPPRSGGELRLYHLYSNIAKHDFSVQMLTPTYSHHAQEDVEHSPNFRETRFPKTKLHNKLHHLNDRTTKFSECSGLVCSIAGRYHSDMKREAAKLAAECDILCQEYVFLTSMIPSRRKAGQLLVYDAHNVETRLAETMFGKGLYGRLATAWLSRHERWMLRHADVIMTCSDDDSEIFHRDFGVDRSRLFVVPNGVDVANIQPCPSKERRREAREILGIAEDKFACFFIGSFHPPNVEATELIIKALAEPLPRAEFLIAGKVCQAFEGRQLPPNVRMLGLVSEEQKMALLHGCDVGLNPMMSGSGTNLKMLDYLAAGVPVLSTPTGARGLAVEHCKHVNLHEPQGLLQGLLDMEGSWDFRQSLAAQGRQLAEAKYSWSAIGTSVANLFQVRTGRRVLILNDYQVLPSEQGGQVRVEAVAKKLAADGLSVSLLTLTTQGPYRHYQVEPGIEEINIPRSYLHRRWDMRFNAWMGCGCDDVSAILFTKWFTPQYGRVLKRELARAGAVMLSHPYMEPMSKGLPRRIKLYYDSHNTEFDLKKKLYPKTSFGRLLVWVTRRAELAAARRARATFCVSNENRVHLEELLPGIKGRTHVAPNGVDCGKSEVVTSETRLERKRKAGLGDHPVALFLGSGHPPNAEAVRLIRDQIAPKHPEVRFLIVGNVTGWFHGQGMGANVTPIGVVGTPVKNYLLQCTDIALNPMLTGSGTSLKLFDYMAHGLPVLSTDVGARGMEGETRDALRILAPQDFSDAIQALLDNEGQREGLGKLARKTAEEYFDWPVALRPMDLISQEWSD